MTIGNWMSFFLISWGAPFTLYLFLQIGAIWNLRGITRKIVLLPIPVMVVVAITAIIGYQQQSN